MTERELSTLHETDYRSGALPVLPLGILLSVGLPGAWSHVKRLFKTATFS